MVWRSLAKLGAVVAGGVSVVYTAKMAERLIFGHLNRYGALLLRVADLEQQIAQLEGANRLLHATLRRPSDKRANQTLDGLPVGTTVPSFRLHQLGGGELSQDDLRGQETLLVFLDPECPPCDRIAPALDRIHRSAAGPRVMAISRGPEAATQAKRAAFGLTFPIALQQHWEVSRRFGIVAAPVAYLIDEHGIIRTEVGIGGPAVIALATQTPGNTGRP